MYKIWKFAQYNDFLVGPENRNTWNKITEIPDPQDMTPKGGFMDALCYREVKTIDINQDCVYFLRLGDDYIMKVGRSTCGQVYHRRINAQTYFFEEVVCEGVQFCDTSKIARKLESEILDYFTPDRQEIRKDFELVNDRNSLLELYIAKYCSDAKIVLQMGEEALRMKRRSK